MTEQGRRWVRMPVAGEFRGEGLWGPYAGGDDYWEWLRATGYLPTWVGAEAPTDERYTASQETKS